MENFVFSIRQYIKYRFKAKHRKGHGIHSPLIFAFVENVLNTKAYTEAEQQNMAIYRQLCSDKTPITFDPKGAKALSQKKNTTIGQLARKTTTQHAYRFLLGRIARFYQFQIVIELGTSLGITSHLLSKSTHGTLFTIEGSETIANIAKKNLAQWECQNCELIISDFDTYLSKLSPFSTPTLVYLDGNHAYAPTLRYYAMLEKLLPPGSILAIGDIYWSPEMKNTWDTICKISENRYTVDLFGVGLCFFHSKAAGQHFIIAY